MVLRALFGVYHNRVWSQVVSPEFGPYLIADHVVRKWRRKGTKNCDEAVALVTALVLKERLGIV